jgi:hypothetical protein
MKKGSNYELKKRLTTNLLAKGAEKISKCY